MTIIKKIKKYNKSLDNNKIIDLKKDYSISFKKNDKTLTLTSNNDKVLVANYIFFGIYQPEKELWIWSSSIPGVNKKQIEYVNEIKKMSHLFENSNDSEILFLYQFLTNDTILINNHNIFVA